MSELPIHEPKIFEKNNNKFIKFIFEECLNKIGFGFGSQQFINILFYQSGASLFLLGLINSFRVILGNISHSMIDRYKNVKSNNTLISISGIIFGFSFLFMAIALFIKSVLLFSIAILISSVSVILYGESINLFMSLKAKIVEKVAKYGLIITTASLFLAAYLLDTFPINGKNIHLNILGNPLSLNIYGYLIVFEVAAISFIIAGYILSKVKSKERVEVKTPNFNYKQVFSNKLLLILALSNIIIGVVQTIGFSYYGLYIFKNFSNQFFGGFLNVAIVFLISVFTSLIGYIITKLNTRVYRKFSMLIFGCIMVTIMPFVYYFQQDLVYITMATIIGIIGSSAVGVTNSLIVIELVNHELRQSYFSFTNLASIPVYLTLAPLLAFFAQIFLMQSLFLILALILAGVSLTLIFTTFILKKDIV